MVVWHVNHNENKGLFSVISGVSTQLNTLGHQSYFITPESVFLSKNWLGKINFTWIKLNTWLMKLLRKILTDNNYYYYAISDFGYSLNVKHCLNSYPKPDIIILYWVSIFLSLEDIKRLKKLTGARIYWYPMDMAPLTGGCHYNWGCEGYKNNCTNCPAIKFKIFNNLSQINLNKKKSIYDKYIDGFLSPTNTISNDIRASKISSKKTVYPLYISPDQNLFKPSDKIDCQNSLKIPTDKFVIFSGAHSIEDPRKGFALLLAALKSIELSHPNIAKNVLLLMVGKSSIDLSTFKSIQIKTLDYLELNELYKAYNAAHVYISPSLEDAGPMMINQALLCATPVISFDVGVARDFLTSEQFGFLVKNKDSIALAETIINAYNIGKAKLAEIGLTSHKEAVRHFGTEATLKNIQMFINSISHVSK